MPANSGEWLLHRYFLEVRETWTIKYPEVKGKYCITYTHSNEAVYPWSFPVGSVAEGFEKCGSICDSLDGCSNINVALNG